MTTSNEKIAEIYEFLDICMLLQCCIWNNPKDEERRLKLGATAILKRTKFPTNRDILLKIILNSHGNRLQFVNELIRRAKATVKSPMEM